MKYELKIAVFTDWSHRREEKRARKERKHQKRQKNVSSSTEESPAKVGNNYWLQYEIINTKNKNRTPSKFKGEQL